MKKLIYSLTLILLAFQIALGQSLDDQLLDAVKANNRSSVIQLLKEGADPDVRDENGATAVMWAVYKADIALLKILIKNGANPSLKGVIYLDSTKQSYYGNLTGIAAGEGNLEKLKYLVEGLKVPVNGRELNSETGYEDGWTAIEWAHRRGHREIEAYLIKQGETLLDAMIRRLQIYLDRSNLYQPLTIYYHFLDIANLSISNGDYVSAEYYLLQAGDLAESRIDTMHPDFSVYLNQLGRLYLESGNFSKAQDYLLRSLQIRESVLGKRHEYVVNTLISLGSLFLDLGQYRNAEKLFLKSSEIAQQNRNLFQQKAILEFLGSIYTDLDEFKKAEMCYLKSLELMSGSAENLSEELYYALNGLGNLYSRNGYYRKAEDCYKRSLDMRIAHFGNRHLKVATALNNLGSLYHSKGELAKAEKCFLKSMEIRQSVVGESHEDFANSLHNLGSLYVDLGDLELAKRFTSQCLSLRLSILGFNHSKTAISLNLLGLIYSNTGEFESAEKCFLQSIEIIQSIKGEENLDLARLLNNLGVLYSENGEHTKALEYANRSLKVKDGLLDSNSISLALTQANVGAQHLIAGNDSVGIALMSEAANVLNTNNRFHATLMSNLSLAYERFGDDKRAVSYSLKHHNLFLELLTEYYSFLSETRLLNIWKENRHSNWSLSSQYFRWSGQNSRTSELFYDLTTATKNSSMTNAVELRSLVEASYDSTLLTVYDQWLAGSVKLSNADPSSLDIGAKFIGIGIGFNLVNDTAVIIGILEGGPAARVDLQIGDRILAVDGLNVAGNSGKHLIGEAIQGPEHSMVELTVSREGEVSFREIKIERMFIDTRSGNAKLKEQVEQLEMQLGHLSSEFLEMQKMGKTKWQEVQGELGEGDVAIEFSSFPYYRVDGTWSDSTLYVALVLRKGYEYPVMVKLCEEKQLDSLFQGEVDREMIAGLYRGAVPVGESGPSYGKRLYELLWEPLDTLLKEGDHIHFAPSGLLHKIALSAIPYGGSDKLLSDRYYLNRLSTTAKLVTDKDKQEKRPEEIVLFGGIDYDLVPSRKDKEQETYVSRALPMDIDRGNTSWSYLPGTLKETESIATIASSKKVKVTTYTGTEATEEQIKSLGGKNSPTVLHIASHGFFFPDPEKDYEKDRMMQMMGDREQVYRYSDDPLNRAGLLFSGANHTWQDKQIPDGQEDGILTANEATYIPLTNTELVVLSACETGLGEIKGSEGVFGLQRAFKAAGAEYVMMSLWKVPDQETSEFMESFYGHYLSDHNIPDSYHHAQRTMRKKYPNEPYKWAGFVLMR